MADAILEKTVAQIDISTVSQTLSAQGEVVIFDGFLKVYMESTDDENENSFTKGVLPPLTVGQKLLLQNMKSREGFSRPPARYTESSLVKKPVVTTLKVSRWKQRVVQMLAIEAMPTQWYGNHQMLPLFQYLLVQKLSMVFLAELLVIIKTL